MSRAPSASPTGTLGAAVRAGLLAAALAPALAGCGSFRPQPLEQVPFLDRAETQREGGVSVTVAVLSPEETRQVFGVKKLAKRGIQPVWVHVVNGEEVPYWFLPVSLDPDYYAPLEAAYISHLKLRKKTNRRMDAHFDALGTGILVPPSGEISGFVHTHLDPGAKHVTLDLVGPGKVHSFNWTVRVPGLTADYQRVDFAALQAEEEVRHLDAEGLRRELEGLPCCTANKGGTKKGDPLNLVVVARPEDLFTCFVRRGWDKTEPITAGTSVRTAKSFLFGKSYRTSPISSLYTYGRPQDLALQKARATIHERNHLRLWLSPLRFDGKPVWVGQISRDIGVRFTTKTWSLTTHKIDPDVDEARDYLLQDLLYCQQVESFGYTAGVGAAPASAPRGNLTGDPYYTDGLRLVLVLGGEPLGFDEVSFLEWERPPTR